MKLVSTQAFAFAIAVLTFVAAPAYATDTLPENYQQWGLPTAADLEVDRSPGVNAEETDLPEIVAESVSEGLGGGAVQTGGPTPDRDGPKGGWFSPTVSKPYWVVPSVVLPDNVHPMAANNNVGIEMHEGRLFMAWRSAPTHFASGKTKMFIVSSPDYGRTWEHEHTIYLGSDMREPSFLSFKGKLIFSFFEAGTNPVAFQPKHLFCIERLAQGKWTEPAKWGEDGEIAWEIKVRNGRAWASSYKGAHYSGTGGIAVHFKVSDDGLNFKHVNEKKPVLYSGGASEAGWEFDTQGDLWAIMRNEDGDKTGFGTQISHAPASDLSDWSKLKKSDRKRYDSPRLFRHGEDIYMVARRDVGGPFDRGWNWIPFDLRKVLYWVGYSLRAKRTALYWIDRKNGGRVVWLQDLPGAGDTAFPSLVQTGPHTWLMANYTSPLRYPRRTWIWGQMSPQGTQLYFSEIRFEAKGKK